MPRVIDGEIDGEGSRVFCPYCLGAAADVADLAVIAGGRDVTTINCDSCGKEFIVETRVSVDWVSRKLAEEEGDALPVS